MGWYGREKSPVISTARCSRRSSVLNLSDKPRSPYRSSVCECWHFKHFWETEQLDPSWAKMTQVDPKWPKLTQGDPSRVDPKRCKLTQVELILTLSRLHSDLSRPYPDHIQIISRLHPDQTNLAKTMQQPDCSRRKGPTFGAWLSPLCIFSVFLVFLKSLVFFVVSTVLRVRCYLHLRWYYLFDFSQMCVLKCNLKASLYEVAESYWLHLFDFPPLCVVRCFLKVSFWEDA